MIIRIDREQTFGKIKNPFLIRLNEGDTIIGRSQPDKKRL